MFIKKVLSSLTLFYASFLFSQTVTSTFDDFTIADCVSTPCQDIIVAGVSLIGIQELSGLVSKLQTEKAELTEEIDELKDRLTLMEQKLNILINQNP